VRLAVNARVVAQAMGGQQRVTAEILKRLGPCEAIAPRRPLGGAAGHAWEQGVLPFRAAGRLLWSPSASGPLAVKRQVVTLHDVAFLDHPEYFSKTFARVYSALIPRLVRRVAKVVTVSEFSRQRIAAWCGLDARDIVVIGNGVSPNFRRYSEDEIARTRAALGLPGRYVLLQATADKRKNLKRSLEAWAAALPDLDGDVTLAVTGNLARAHVFGDIGPISETPRTKLLGFVDEAHIGPLTAGAEAFLFPSIYEGFGLPIVEAMACGAPVLTSDASSTAEIAGGAALLVDPLDVRSIAAGIVRLMRDAESRERLRAGGVVRARVFDWDDAAARYRALFAELGAATL
jgi:glycosyltransferase involved in cell wall biosynthesis